MATTNNALNRKSSMHIFLTGRSRGDAKHDFKSLNKIKEALQSNGFTKSKEFSEKKIKKSIEKED